MKVDNVTIALMGLRGRGQSLARSFAALPDVDFAYACDVDQNVVDPAQGIIEEAKGKRPPLVTDIRRVLDDQSVDAVVMATPIHWHAPGTILACAAGKDVYVEKPASHNIREGRLMVEAARRNGRVVQLGTQSRSRPVTQAFVDYVQSGKLGDVLMAKVWNVQMRRNIGHRADEPVPPGIDYETWTGPLPKMQFNRNRFHGTVNWHWHYGAGDIGNDGVHWIDIARWALGVGTPQEVSGMGKKLYFDDDQQTPRHDESELQLQRQGHLVRAAPLESLQHAGFRKTRWPYMARMGWRRWAVGVVGITHFASLTPMACRFTTSRRRHPTRTPTRAISSIVSGLGTSQTPTSRSATSQRRCAISATSWRV